MSTNRKSLLLAATLIAALLGLVVYLVTAGSPPRHDQPEAAGAAARPADPEPRLAPPRRPTPAPRVRGLGQDLTREQYAAELQQRYRRKDQLIAVEAISRDGRVLRLSWPEGAAAQDHIERLKQAGPFHRELRGRGFSSLVLRVGERVLWSGRL